MAIDVRFGKSRIWVGAPLRIFVKVQGALKRHSPEEVLISYKNSETNECNELKLALDKNWEVVADIPTRKLLPGAYEITASMSDYTNLKLVEPVLILSEKQFVDLAREDASEEFQAAPGIRDVKQLKNFIEEIVRERLRAPLKASEQGGKFLSQIPLSASESFKRPVSSAPIEWTTEAMVNEINYLALAGTKTFRFHIEFLGGIFGLRFSAVLNKALPGEVALLYKGRQIREFSFLNLRKDLRSFQEKVDVTAFDPNIELYIQHEVYGFPVLGADAGADVRPKPRYKTAGG